MKRLFRKVSDKSADYDPSHPGNVRRDGSYIYEVFLPTGGVQYVGVRSGECRRNSAAGVVCRDMHATGCSALQDDQVQLVGAEIIAGE